MIEAFLRLLAKPEVWVEMSVAAAAVLILHRGLYPRQWERFDYEEVWGDNGETRTQRIRERGARAFRRIARRPSALGSALGAVLLVPVFVMWLGPLGPFFAILIGGYLGGSAPSWFASRSDDRIDVQTISFLYTLVTQLRTDKALFPALRDSLPSASEPLRGQIDRLVRYTASYGFDTACQMAYAEVSSPFLRRAIRILARSHRSAPSNIAVRCEHLASALNQHLALQRKLRSILSGINWQKRFLMGVLPALFGLMVMIRGAETMSFFWTTLPGQIALFIVVLIWIGTGWLSSQLARLSL